MKMHPDITEEAIVEAVQSGEYKGFCIFCGEEAFGVEPDAREYNCESCEEPGVYGAEELLLYIV